MEVNHYLKLFGYPYDIFFCVQNNNVNDDRIVILGWTIPLKMYATLGGRGF